MDQIVANKSGAALAAISESGKLLWKERLPDSCWVSPMAAGDRVYFFTMEGKTVVVSIGNKFEELAENTLSIDDSTRVYGVAAVKDMLLFRTDANLYCIRRP